MAFTLKKPKCKKNDGAAAKFDKKIIQINCNINLWYVNDNGRAQQFIANCLRKVSRRNEYSIVLTDNMLLSSSDKISQSWQNFGQHFTILF